MKYISSNIFPKGVITAIVTPFKFGQVDHKTLDQLIKMQIADGAQALVILGTTGEASSLSEKERAKIIERTVQTAGSELEIIVGIGSNDTEKTISLGKQAFALGADGVLAVTPYYVKPNQQGLIRHYSVLADAVQCPVIMYNVPSRTGVNISCETLNALLSHGNISALKEAGGDTDDILHKLICSDPSRIYCGNDLYMPLFASLGAAGVISVASNACYKRMSEIFDTYSSGKTAKANEMFAKIRPFFKALCCDTNPIPIKSIMADMGLIENGLRLPLTKLDDKKRSMLLTAAVDSEII